MQLRAFFTVTKPGIIGGNLITTAGAYALSTQGTGSLWQCFILLLSMGSVIGSACVWNNYIDKSSDQKMSRTANRPFAKGTLAIPPALFFASLLGALGITLLIVTTNSLAATLAGAGFAIYVLVYSFLKYHSSYATLIGSLAGAVPPLVGYCAARGTWDLGASILLLMMTCWQMSHFFAIAIYRLADYTAANIPVWPVAKGIPSTKRQMLFYTIGFIGSAWLLVLSGYATRPLFFATTFSGTFWLILALRGVMTYQGKRDDSRWARHMFIASLVAITMTFLVMWL